ncbi:Hypothetical protein NTJ_00098 [Nesidiocoris tenuis]|uniref:Uncharacterized protein n=1 Tax=Nesidiocoris tenuis TaxID=355587 RepID=A0ABN7A5Y5_9HEMI|nr:Hypothetical protein NTJ_00098 [Nesidiocoris tenuis]
MSFLLTLARFPTVHNYGRDFPVFTGEIPSPSACGKEGKFLGNSAEPSERGYRTADRDEETGGVGGGKIGGGKPAGVEAAPVWQRQRRQWASLHLIRPRRPRAVYPAHRRLHLTPSRIPSLCPAHCFI